MLIGATPARRELVHDIEVLLLRIRSRNALVGAALPRVPFGAALEIKRRRPRQFAGASRRLFEEAIQTQLLSLGQRNTP